MSILRDFQRFLIFTQNYMNRISAIAMNINNELDKKTFPGFIDSQQAVHDYVKLANFAFLYNDFASSFNYLSKTFKIIAKDARLAEMFPSILLMQASLFKEVKNFPRAIEKTKKAYFFYEQNQLKNIPLHGKIFYMLGSVYAANFTYNLATKCLYVAYRLFESIQDKEGEQRVLYLLASFPNNFFRSIDLTFQECIQMSIDDIKFNRLYDEIKNELSSNLN